MEYIKNADYDYIMNKYHSQSEPFDAFSRFIRHDAVFDESTGLSGEEIISGIKINDEALKELSHPVRKGKALEYILKNTRINCDKRDIFPAINMVDRPLNKTVIDDWREKVFYGKIPEIEKQRNYLCNNGIATVWPDYDHCVPVWDRVFDLGFIGILKESEEARDRIDNISLEQTNFFDGIKITYNSILMFLERLRIQSEKQENFRMAKALENLISNPPKSFYEALLLDYIYFMICEHIEGLQVRSLSNFDRNFYRFYKNDLQNGISEEQIRKDLAYFFLQFTAIGNYWGQPVYLGGCKEDESTIINELSYLFLDVYDEIGIYNPKIQIKIAESTPKDFILKALDMIRRGNNSIVFVGDATIRKSLENFGFTPEQARTCDVKGCYEYSIQGAYGSAAMNYVNLLKPLEYALHEGCDGVKGTFAGVKSPKVEDYNSFEEFFAEYKKQLLSVIEQVVNVTNSFEIYLSEINPQSMLSATIPSCLKKGKDVMCGGAEANGNCMMFGFMADIADSLTAIKKYVFDDKKLSLAELRDVLDSNFEGQEKLRLMLLNDCDKYGNNRELPDSIAVEIADFLTAEVCGRPTSVERGGRWNIGFHVARMSYIQAPHTAASPNGRLRGEELSKNLSASMGMNREGATAAILSITKIDATKFTSDATLDLGLLPSAVKGEDGLEAMYALLMTFMKRKGHAMHINVFDADTLRAAQREPEKYRDLQIRVCGWNVLFNNINKEEQDGFIRQAEGLV
ncbi:MAG: pyruvate formate lyase family protein [Acutalibacteraceae bacterium]|nr:pyruvate formate lyase family protein [Acutalibacteraceae bacterium]